MRDAHNMSAVRAEGVRRVASSPHAVARARIGTSNGRAVRYHWLGWDGGLVNNYVVTTASLNVALCGGILC